MSFEIDSLTEVNYDNTELSSEDNDVFQNDDILILGSKGNEESSSDLNSLNIDDLHIKIKKENLNEDFYDLNKITNVDNLYDIFDSCDMLIFVDNCKLNLKPSCFSRCKVLKESKFPGCTFLPFEYVNYIKKYIHELNTQIAKNKIKNLKIKNGNDFCSSIYFDEGDVKKNCVYKKMEIMDKILFVPINRYQIKKTEYKIRGFCQIAEELGANKIEINFERNTSSTVNKKIDVNLDTQINLFAGELGLVSNNTDKNSQNQSYILEYPSINTILLNEKSLLKKIRKKKFIISENMYNSNLELQYLVHSRCRHFITNYSTVFTLDSTINIDKELKTKFKSHGINLGTTASFSNSNSNMVKIITKVTFSSQTDYYNHLSGHSVSLDKVGFRYLTESFNNDEELFKISGIYKIMTFIDLYIEKILKHEKDSRYEFVKFIIKQVKKNLSLEEYAEILCNYFNCSSQWIHFIHFIDLLSNETHSYDKLGYLIIINDKEKTNDERLQCIIKFIQERCIHMNIENKFWEMLKPHRRDLKYHLRDKLYNKYDFIEFFNWYGLDNLINDIKKYSVSFENKDNEETFKLLINNMKLGYSHLEFYNNLLPFIIRYYYSLNYDDEKNELILSNLLEESISYESFIVSKVNNLSDLKDYLVNKVKRIKMIFTMVEVFKNSYFNNNLDDNKIDNLYIINNFISNTFSKNYKYFNKKLNIIATKNYSDNLDKLFSNNNNLDENLFKFLKRLLIFNEKLNINEIPLNNFGFELVIKNYNNGIKEIQFNNEVKLFINRLYKSIISNHFCCISNEFKILTNLNINDLISFDYFKENIETFYDLVKEIKSKVEGYNENINLTDKVVTNLCF
tara:strand:+ start:3817 stop:6369 length:2553 start_codon:yes stop_codon:yes gene_type:complete